MHCLSWRSSDPESLLDLLTSEQMVSAITSSPAYQKQMQTDQFREFIGIVRYLESKLNTDWQTGLRKLLGGGVTFAVLPGDAVLLGVDAKDPELLEQLHEIVLNFSRDEARRQGEPERVKSADYRGLTGWTFGGSEAHVLIDGRLLMTNKPDALKPALDLAARAGSRLGHAARLSGRAGCGRVRCGSHGIRQHAGLAATSADSPGARNSR